MPSVSEKVELMQKYFPKCPICGSEKGYRPSVFYPNVQCRLCKAEWLLHEDGLELKGAPEKEFDRRLLNKKKTFQFWGAAEAPRLVKKKFIHTGMSKSEYEASMNNLGLLEGEEIRLQYVIAFRRVFRKSAITQSGLKEEAKKGLLVFTNNNLIFMQQEGIWSSNYSQALRIPLENITGLESGGTLVKHIRVRVGVGGAPEEHEFNFRSDWTDGNIHEIREEIEELLKEVRQEKKRLAQEALATGTVPAMIFCKYCGARNKADQSRCLSCGAPLT